MSSHLDSHFIINWARTLNHTIPNLIYAIFSTDPLRLKIALGMHTIGDPTEKIYDVVGTVLHPKFYAFPTYDNYDIAIIEVSPTIVFSEIIRPICIPSLGKSYQS